MTRKEAESACISRAATRFLMPDGARVSTYFNIAPYTHRMNTRATRAVAMKTLAATDVQTSGCRGL